MNTNFFSQIQQLDFTGNLQLNIAKGVENNLIVSVLPQNEQCGDDAKKLIIPYNLNATPEELDKSFFEKITKPVETASALMDNMEQFQKQLDDAKKQSAMEKQKSDKEKKAQDAKEKKYRDAMAKADELEKVGKYREAWIKVPEPSEFPDKKEEINKRRSALSAQFEPDLFATAVKEDQKQNETEHPNPEALYPDYQVDTVEEEMESEYEEEQEY